MSGEIIAVCTSKHKGTPKTDVRVGYLEEGLGLRGRCARRRLASSSVADIC